MDEEESYKNAKKRVDELKDFYAHLIVNVVLGNSFLWNRGHLACDCSLWQTGQAG